MVYCSRTFVISYVDLYDCEPRVVGSSFCSTFFFVNFEKIPANLLYTYLYSLYKSFIIWLFFLRVWSPRLCFGFDNTSKIWFDIYHLLLHRFKQVLNQHSYRLLRFTLSQTVMYYVHGIFQNSQKYITLQFQTRNTCIKKGTVFGILILWTPMFCQAKKYTNSISTVYQQTKYDNSNKRQNKSTIIRLKFKFPNDFKPTRAIFPAKSARKNENGSILFSLHFPHISSSFIASLLANQVVKHTRRLPQLQHEVCCLQWGPCGMRCQGFAPEG